MTKQGSVGRKNKVQILATTAALAALMAIPVATTAQDESMAPTDENAMVRVGHFSPDAPAVDIYANGAILAGLEGVEFGTLSGYIEVPADTYSIAVVVAGQDPADATVIGPADIPLEAGSKSTIAATGFVADIAPVILNDNVDLTEGQAQVRIVHFSPDAPAVDVAPDGADALLTDLAFPNDTGYVALDAGEYDLEVRVAGTEDVAIQLDPLALDGDTAYSVFAIGSLADGTLTALPVVDATAIMGDEMARVRVGHFSADAPNVDVYANGGLALSDVPFGALSGYLEVPAGTYRFQVVPAGNALEDGPVVIDAEVDLEGGTSTTVAATNDLANIAPVVINDQAVASGLEGAKVRVVHLSANAPKVDIAPDGSGKAGAIFKNLKFGKAKGYADVPAGEVDLEVRPAGKKKAAFDIPALSLEDGKAYSAFAIGQFPDSFDVILVEEALAS